MGDLRAQGCAGVSIKLALRPRSTDLLIATATSVYTGSAK